MIALSKEDRMPTPELASKQMVADVISGIARVDERIIPVLDLEYILIREEVTEPSDLRQ
jgi:chemotaxis signal transduction protein